MELHKFYRQVRHHMPGHIGPFTHTKIVIFGRGGGRRWRSTEDHKILRIVTHTLICTGGGQDTLSLGADDEQLLKELGPRMAEV